MVKWRKWLPVVMILAVCVAWFGGYVLDHTFVRRQSVTDFAASEVPTLAEVEVVGSGRLFDHIAVYSIPMVTSSDYYNYGLALYGKGIAMRQELALVQENTVYRLPTVMMWREDLLEELDLEEYDFSPANFYVGLESRFWSFQIPGGSYKLAVLQLSEGGIWQLLTVGEVEL